MQNLQRRDRGVRNVNVIGEFRHMFENCRCMSAASVGADKERSRPLAVLARWALIKQ